MIHPSQLLIGSYVMYDNEVCEVYEALIHGVHLKTLNGGMYTHVILYKDLSGLPITPELLKRCGFEGDKNFYFRKDVDWRLSEANMFSYYVYQQQSAEENDILLRRVHYMHELQLLFTALTGHQLKMKEEK